MPIGMATRICLVLLGVFSLFAAEKKLPIEETSNDVVAINATIILDRDAIKNEIGSDFGGDLVLVRVKIRPVNGKTLRVSLDDFLLVSAKDGQRGEPYAPSQLAGDTTLMVTPQGAKNAGLAGRSNGPIWGGAPGTTGRPQQLPGSGGGIGNTGGDAGGELKVENVKDGKPNPLLSVLKDKCLQEKEIADSEEGLLYFPAIGKVKSKDVELHYKGPGGRLGLRFRP